MKDPVNPSGRPSQDKPGSTCARLPRCRKCGRVLAFVFADLLCQDCADALKKGVANG